MQEAKEIKGKKIPREVKDITSMKQEQMLFKKEQSPNKQ